jgi:hypothetical protein
MLRSKDCYYTKQEIARQLVALLPPIPPGVTVVDPCAGSGAFSSCFKKCIALDLHPAAPGIAQADYFQWEPPTGSRLWIVSNPPFGNGAALAIRFFNRNFGAELIAFVLPRVWRKRSVLSRLDLQYSVVAAHPVPANAFITPEGKEIDVPTDWTIWTRAPRPPPPPPLTNPAVHFLPSATGADLVVQRLGRDAGRIQTKARSGRSYLYLRISDADLLARVRAQPNCFRESEQRDWCAGMPGLNHQDILEILDSMTGTRSSPPAPPPAAQ